MSASLIGNGATLFALARLFVRIGARSKILTDWEVR